MIKECNFMGNKVHIIRKDDPENNVNELMRIEDIFYNKNKIDRKICFLKYEVLVEIITIFTKNYLLTNKPLNPEINFNMKINMKPNHRSFSFIPRRLSY